MNYKSHRIGGICAGLVVATSMFKAPYQINDIAGIICLTAASGFGSFLPDLDEPQSAAGKHAKPVSYVIKAAAGHRGVFHTPFMLAIIDILIFISYLFVKNNTIVSQDTIRTAITVLSILVGLGAIATMIGTKRLNFTTILWSIASLYELWVVKDIKLFLLLSLYGISVGFLSHLLMDSLTVGGISWFYPFTKKKFRFAKLRTNEHEWLARIIFIVPTIIALYFTMQPYTTDLIKMIT